MTTAERVQAVVDYGFTERQARFLVLVMRHSGLCVKRQYAAFAGIASGGEKCNAFFAKLVRRGFAVATDCMHNRARLYHVHHKPLYHAIGEPDSRYRRMVSARSAAERLMRLDAAMTCPDLDWLTTRPEKLAYVQSGTTLESSPPVSDDAVHSGPNLASQFPGTFPIGVDRNGHVLLLYLATVPWTDDFRTFVVGHTALLTVARAWTLRVLFPRSVQRVMTAYQTVADEELLPLQADTIADLRRHFFHRRRATDLNAIPESLRAFLIRCAEAFRGARFAHLYKRWLTEEDAALKPVSSVIQEALAAGHGHVDYVVLPHTYEHLSPLLSRRRVQRRRRRTSDETGEETPRGINPFLNPAP